MTGLMWLAAVGLLLAAAAVAGTIQRSRRSRLARLRAGWGRPVDRIRKMDAIAASCRSRVAESGASAVMDDRTWNDLDLDAVFAALDRTVSTLGQHALYYRLRSAPLAAHLEAFESLVTRMSADAPARERAQLGLARLQDPHGYDLWWLARPDAVDMRPWFVLFPVLSGTALTALLLTLFRPALLPVLAGAIALNIAVRYATDRRIDALVGAFRQLAPVVAAGESLRFLQGADVEPLIGPLGSDVARLRRLKTISRWVSGDPLMLSFSGSVFQHIITDIANALYAYVNLFFLIEASGVFAGGRDLRAHGSSLVRVVSAIGEVDAALSVASWRAGRDDWTRPRFPAAGAPAVLADIRHPLVADAVPNTTTIEPGHGLLVTGSNMSGKSTFLRTIGVTTVLAQTIHTCLAARYEAPVLCVRSCVGRSDDLLAGKSYYAVEVEVLLDLVRASRGTAPHLFLLDELFRGTNAVERIAAGHAVLCELVTGRDGPTPHVVIAATHDGELVDLLPEPFAACHFGAAVGGDGLAFDYRLRPGPATARNAIALLRLHGAPESLVNRAVLTAAALDRQRDRGRD
jgi:hypothetical protein